MKKYIFIVHYFDHFVNITDLLPAFKIENILIHNK